MKEKLELTLDGRQIVGTLVGALVALGATFGFGVAVGKRSSETSRPSSEDVLSALDERTAKLQEVRADAALTFQDELTRQRPLELPPSEPTKTVVVTPAPEGPAAAEPTATSKPVPSVGLGENKLSGRITEAQVPTRTASGEQALKDALSRAAQSPAHKAPEVAAGGAFTLQLAASQVRAEAERFAGNLREKGYAPFIVEAHVPGKGTFYRVRMGRFGSKEAALRYLQDFKRETSVEAFVAQVDGN